jgi:hypothetical protein
LNNFYGDKYSQLKHKDNKIIGHKSFADRNKYIEVGEKYLEISLNLAHFFVSGLVLVGKCKES